jgi:hypothetical protein
MAQAARRDTGRPARCILGFFDMRKRNVAFEHQANQDRLSNRVWKGGRDASHHRKMMMNVWITVARTTTEVPSLPVYSSFAKK